MNVTINNTNGKTIVVESGATYVENATQYNFCPSMPKSGQTPDEEAADDSTATDWARRHFDNLSTIYPSWQKLAVKAANVRRLYFETSQRNEERGRWRTQCVRDLFFPPQRDKQWLRDTAVRLEIIKELINDDKITKDTLTDAKKGYKFIER